MNSVIRLGGTETSLLAFSWLRAQGLSAGVSLEKNFLRYAWNTMGFYDKSHLLAEDLQWESDFSYILCDYMSRYLVAARSFDSSILLPAHASQLSKAIAHAVHDSPVPGLGAEQLEASFFEYVHLPRLRVESFNWKKVFESLKGKQTLIVSPFARLMEQQWNRGSVELLSPDFKIVSPRFLPYPYCFGNSGPHQTTLDTISEIASEIRMISDGFDAILVACGSAGPILINSVSDLFGTRIYSGADLQLVFGINGKRWTDHVVTLPSFRDHPDRWIMNVPDGFRPANADIVEGGCYW